MTLILFLNVLTFHSQHDLLLGSDVSDPPVTKGVHLTFVSPSTALVQKVLCTQVTEY